MRLCVDWYGLGCGRVSDCGRDGAGEGGDEGGKDRWVYDGQHIHVVVLLFFVLPNPVSSAAHPVGFVASQIKAWVW